MEERKAKERRKVDFVFGPFVSYFWRRKIKFSESRTEKPKESERIRPPYRPHAPSASFGNLNPQTVLERSSNYTDKKFEEFAKKLAELERTVDKINLVDILEKYNREIQKNAFEKIDQRFSRAKRWLFSIPVAAVVSIAAITGGIYYWNSQHAERRVVARIESKQKEYDRNVKQLKSEVSKFSSKISTLEGNSAAFEKTISFQQAELDKYEKREKTRLEEEVVYRAEITGKFTEIDKKAREIIKSIAEVNEIYASLKKKSEENYNELLARLDTKNQDIAALEAKVKAVNDDNQKFLETYKSDREAYEKDKALSGSQLENYKRKLNDTQEELKKVSKNLEEVKKMAEDTKKTLQNNPLNLPFWPIR